MKKNNLYVLLGILITLTIIWQFATDVPFGYDAKPILLGSIGMVLVSSFVSFLLYGSYLTRFKRSFATMMLLIGGIIVGFVIGNLDGLHNGHIALLLATLSSFVVLGASVWNWDEMPAKSFEGEKRKHKRLEAPSNIEDDESVDLPLGNFLEETEETENQRNRYSDQKSDRTRY